jgi:hypothetical protein
LTEAVFRLKHHLILLKLARDACDHLFDSGCISPSVLVRQLGEKAARQVDLK